MTYFKRVFAAVGMTFALAGAVVGTQVGASASKVHADSFFTYTGADYTNLVSCQDYGQFGQDEGYWTVFQCRHVGTVYQLWVHYI